MEHFLLHLAKTSAIVGAVIALALILRPVLQKRFASKARYWLWLVLAVALVPSPVYTGANAPVQITPPSEHVFVWPDKQAIAPKIVHKDVFIPEDVAPAISSVQPGEDFTQSLPTAPIRRVVEVSTVMFWAWLAGAAVFLAVQGVGYARFRRLTRRWSEAPTNERYGEILREEADALGVTAPKLTVCAPVPTPALTGLARPTLLLPHENYTEAELRFILRHELYHLKRRDILYKSFLTFVNALHWFNPLVYLMLRAADEDIELSCDSAVTANMEKAERTAYSETLLKSVRERHGAVALTTCFGSTLERLKRRLTNVFDDDKKSRGVAVVLLTVFAVVGLSAAIGFAPASDAKPLAKTQGEYADVEDYLMHKMPAIGSEVSYYAADENGKGLKVSVAVLDRKLDYLNKTGEVTGLAPEGTLQSWEYNYLLQLDEPAGGVILADGTYEQHGYFYVEGQDGHNLVVLQYDDGSIDVLYDQHVNDNMDFYGYHLSYEEALYDWYVIENNLDQTEYPRYVIDWSDYFREAKTGNYPVHRYDGDGWYIYIPVSAWEPGVGEPIWYSSYGTESTIVVKSFDTPLSDAQAYFEREGWEGMDDDMIFVSYEGRFSNVYLYERPTGGHYEVQLFADFEKMAEIAETCPEADKETPILIRMAQSFTVDERFSPALWTDPLYADALLNAKPITYADETRSVPYFTTDILTNLTRDDTHEYPDGGAAFAVVDLDGDGTAEVVYRRSDYCGYIVMHTYYGGVCGHELNYREMISLKRDGSMLGSGGADDTSFTRIRFDGADMVTEYSEYCLATPQSMLRSDNVTLMTQEELDSFIAAFEARPDVTWYDCTEENVRSVLGTNRGTRTVAFDDIMGLSGFYSETVDGANFITRTYYVPAVVGGYTPIGESFGYTIDDHVVDLDGDGVTELVCNCQYGADGAQRVFVYQLDTREGTVMEGTYYPVYSELPNYNDWGVNSSAEYYAAGADEFILRYDTKDGSTAAKKFSYRELSFIRYTANDTPFPQPVLPEKASTAVGTQSRVLEVDGKPVSLDLNGYFWFASTDGWICREKDGKTEKLYELPINYYITDTFVIPALRMQEDYATLTYHIGRATMGTDMTIRFFDDGSYIEMPVNSSTSTQGDLWVSISNFVPPERGNLRISRDGGETWNAFGSPEILYGWTYTAEGDYKSNIRNGTMYITDDAVYLLGTYLDAAFDGTPSVTRVCRIDLITGETEMLTSEAKEFSIVGQWIHYTSPNGTGHTCPLAGDLVPTVKYPQTGKWKS